MWSIIADTITRVFPARIAVIHELPTNQVPTLRTFTGSSLDFLLCFRGNPWVRILRGSVPTKCLVRVASQHTDIVYLESLAINGRALRSKNKICNLSNWPGLAIRQSPDRRQYNPSLIHAPPFCLLKRVSYRPFDIPHACFRLRSIGVLNYGGSKTRSSEYQTCHGNRCWMILFPSITCSRMRRKRLSLHSLASRRLMFYQIILMRPPAASPTGVDLPLLVPLTVASSSPQPS